MTSSDREAYQRNRKDLVQLPDSDTHEKVTAESHEPDTTVPDEQSPISVPCQRVSACQRFWPESLWNIHPALNTDTYVCMCVLPSGKGW